MNARGKEDGVEMGNTSQVDVGAAEGGDGSDGAKKRSAMRPRGSWRSSRQFPTWTAS